MELIAKASLPGTAFDLSRLSQPLDRGLPQNRFGGISALEYSGKGTLYYALSDRGPGDGAYPYACRLHLIDIQIEPAHPGELKLSLVATVLLKTENGALLVGALNAFDPVHPERSLRFDPEGIRCGRDGNLFISDEYGIVEFEDAATGLAYTSKP